jgi:hypothetical protein
VDRRPELEILPAGDLVAGLVLTLEVRASGAETARVFLDGEELRQVAVNQRVQIRAVEWAPGRHALRVRLDWTPYPREVERAVIVGAPLPEILVSPPGPVSAATPFDVSIQSTEDLDVEPGVSAVTVPGGEPVPMDVLRPNDRTVTLRVQRALRETGPIRLEGAVRTRWTGYVFPLRELRYEPSPVPITFLSPLPGSFSTAPVRVHLDTAPDVGAPITITADCGGILRTAAIIEDGGEHVSTWDPGDAPDGACALRADAEGWLTAPGPSFRLDRVAPAITRCISTGNVRGDVRIELDPDAPDPTDTTGANLSAEGPNGPVGLGVRERGAGYVVVGIDARFEPPADVTFMMAPLADAAGNFGGESRCTVSYPGWWRPLEWPALDLAPAGITPGSLAIERRGLQIALAWIDGDGVGWTASVRDGRPADVAPIATGGAPISEVIAGIDSNAWVERPAGGPPAVRVGSARLERGAGSDPRELTLSTASAAWTETGPDGLSRVAYGPRSLAAVSYVPSGASSAARSPTVSESFATWIAWIEEPTGGPASLRVWFDGAAVPPVSPALDPLAEASTPSMYESWLAWEEGGRVLITTLWQIDGITWREPEVLSAEGVAARDPTVARGTPHPTAAWLEAVAAGEQLASRRWDGESWRSATTVEGLDLPPGGEVVFSRADPAVAWIDAAGTLHVAATNTD